MHSIEISHLTKRYKNGVTALDDISFHVDGGVYGLLGHNGAGKTTLMKALTTILRPSAGTVRICGYDTVRQGEQVRSRIGYLPQELAMYPSLSVFDFVSYMAQLKGIRGKKGYPIKSAVNTALEMVGMQEFGKRKIGQLSGGMKRRVGIAQALVGNPEILIVDEPTAGLDPEERVRFRGILSRFAKDGKTVLLSTHIVEDVYRICEKLAVLRNGHLFYAGTSAGLMRRATVLSTAYESHGLTARVMDEGQIFAEPAVPATLEDAYIYCMGGKRMRKVSVIAHYEYKMLMTSRATWGVLLASIAISLSDNYPSAHNLARLEFLSQPAYFLYRTISLDALILAFGLLFLLSGRFPADRRYGLTI